MPVATAEEGYVECIEKGSGVGGKGVAAKPGSMFGLHHTCLLRRPSLCLLSEEDRIKLTRCSTEKVGDDD